MNTVAVGGAPSNTNTGCSFPVVIGIGTMLSSRPCFIYRLASDPDKCYKFYWNYAKINQSTGSSMQFYVTCAGCANEKVSVDRIGMTGLGLWTDGFTMLSDPCTSHRCTRPLNYNYVIKKTPLVSDSVKRRILQGDDITYGILVEEAEIETKRRVDASVETRLPHSVNTLAARMAPSQGVDGGVTSTSNEITGCPFPVVIGIHHRYGSKPCFIYRIASHPDKCYKFNLMGKAQIVGSSTQFPVKCSGCAVIQFTNNLQSTGGAKRVRRRTNGITMLTDPLKSHKCSGPLDYNDVIEKNPLVSDSVKRRILQGDYITYDVLIREGSLVKRQINDRSSLADDGVDMSSSQDTTGPPTYSSDHRDHGESIGSLGNESFDENDNWTSPHGHSLSDHRPKEQMIANTNENSDDDGLIDSKDDVNVRCLTSRSIEDDSFPAKKKEQAVVRKRKMPLQNIESSSSSKRSNEDNEVVFLSEDSMVAIEHRRGRMDEPIDTLESMADVAPSSTSGRRERHAVVEKRQVNTSQSVTIDSYREAKQEPIVNQVQIPDKEPLHTPLLPTGYPSSTPLTTLSVSASSLPHSLTVERKISVAPPETFERKFDTENYKEHEVDVSVSGNTLRILFERKSVSGPSSTSRHLLYQYALPSYVLLSSISTSWLDGFLVVRAQTIRHP